MSPEKREGMNPEILNEHISDTLLDIHTQLRSIRSTPEVLNDVVVDSIVSKLEALENSAINAGDEAKKIMFSTLGTQFYSLRTIGIVDDRKKFESEAAHAFELLEMALLGMDGTVQKNKGKIVAAIQEEKERYT